MVGIAAGTINFGGNLERLAVHRHRERLATLASSTTALDTARPPPPTRARTRSRRQRRVLGRQDEPARHASAVQGLCDAAQDAAHAAAIAAASGLGVKTKAVRTKAPFAGEALGNGAVRLAVKVYEALTGAHPICPEPANVYEICSRQIGYRPRPLIEVLPAVPPQLAAAVDRAIEKDPALRFPDATAFAGALHAALLTMGEARLAALRDAAGGPRSLPGRTVVPVATTQATKALGHAPTQPLTRPAKTEPLDGATEEPGRGSITAPPTTRPAPIPRASDPAAVVVVAVAVALGLACGVWLVLWVIPWPR